MKPFMEPLMGGAFGVELLYSFVIIVCSLMVYYGTREIYELSSHKGIKYFRYAFLFFAIAYFFRSFIKFVAIYFNISEIMELSPRIFGPITLFLFMYFSSMAVFYLLYSVMWKKWNGSSKKVYIFHGLAFVIALLSIALRGFEFRFWLNFILLMLVLFVVYVVYREGKDKKKRNNLYAIYLLLFVFFILNIFDILIPRFLETFRLIIYLASAGIFLLILYRVLKKSGN
jgi:hypothetical protein